MVSNATFFYTHTINVFCDASCIEIRPMMYQKFNATSPGFIATYRGRILATGMDIYLLENSYYGEAKALDLAVNWCIYAASRGLYVPEGFSIFSDSLSGIQAIHKKLIEWFEMIEKKQKLDITNKSRCDVMNSDDIVFNTAYSIFTSGLTIRLFYVAGHVPLRPFNGQKAQEKFLALNEQFHGDLTEEMTIQIAHEQATFNNMVDLMTRNFLVVHKQDIENDIDTREDADILLNKAGAIRWPFVTTPVITPSLPLLLEQY